MQIKLTNTLSHLKESFVPIDQDKVGLYVCGPTVYDRAHIGNARPAVIFDVLFRVLKKKYTNVIYVRNITDVDDKINDRSRELNISIRQLTDKTLAQYHADIDALGCLRPDIEPRATEHINEMIEMIELLISKGHAYVENEHVFFSVLSYDQYGILSRKNQNDLIAGARVEIGQYKQNPADFVLWKPSEDGGAWLE